MDIFDVLLNIVTILVFFDRSKNLKHTEKSVFFGNFIKIEKK